ncbi:MAG: anaerobic ribonucleoside-triphosphate reductase activating protein [Oscillospiraceae bacterium]|jgi:anaerobic ribonucleoside-triphosphate reductase activating protein|nr:anaerobic ribonucleoside-triphosphate reductase activating protein [Oscillospiraceae bacterium]
MAGLSEQKIRIAGTVSQSVVDGPGLRFVVFTQGCPHRCPGCHNPETHDFAAGGEASAEALLAAMDKNPLLMGATISGGEPVCQAAALLPFARAVVSRGKDVVLFTGYTFEELLEKQREDESLGELLRCVRLVIDGRFELERRDLTLRFRGSCNQRVLDMPASLREGAAVWAQGYQPLADSDS